MAKKKNLVKMLNGTTSKLDKIFTPDAPATEVSREVAAGTFPAHDRTPSASVFSGLEAQKQEIAERTRETLKAKRGRPAVKTAEDEVNVTFKLSADLMQEIRVKAAMERTTQKEIVDAALRSYLNRQ